MDPRELYVIVPAYNEGPVLGEVLRELLSVYPNVVVVDDGSSDTSHAIALRSGAHVLHHTTNLGQGAALQTGLTYALDRGARLLCTFDADGQHRVEDIATLAEALVREKADVALGSRFLGTAERMPTAKRLTLKAAVVFTRVVGGIRITDTHNGLRVLTAEAARRLTITQTSMAHASEILHKIVKYGFKHVEVPITVRYTDWSLKKGQSLLNAVNIVFDLMVRRLLD